jgi:hypothetical protein
MPILLILCEMERVDHVRTYNSTDDSLDSVITNLPDDNNFMTNAVRGGA